MPWSLDRVDVRRGIVAIIDGIALWFLTILGHAYSTADVLPWASIDDFSRTAVSVIRQRLASPGFDGSEAAIYLGFVLIVGGPLWFWLILPLIRSRFATALDSLPIPTQRYEPDRTLTVLGWQEPPNQARRYGMPSGTTAPTTGRPIIEFRRPEIPTGTAIREAFRTSIQRSTPDQRTRIRFAIIGIAVGMMMAASGAFLLFGGELGAEGSTRGTGGPAAAVNHSTVERAILADINERRSDQNISSLTWDSRLANVSVSHSRDMKQNDYTGHIDPSGNSLSDRLERAEYQCESAAELVLSTHYRKPVRGPNGTVTYTTPDELAAGIVRSWNRSSRHRSIILDPRWNVTGVGIAIDSQQQVYITVTVCGKIKEP